jgi:hypothetical protein
MVKQNETTYTSGFVCVKYKYTTDYQILAFC